VTITPPEFETTPIDGLVVMRAKQVTDERGTVREAYRASAVLDAGLAPLERIVQVNVTRTEPGAVRGIHAEDMTKLVGIAVGEGLGVYVDLRRESATCGVVHTVALVPGVHVLVPRGVGNGFQACGSEPSEYLYFFDDEWQPGMTGAAITPLDPALGIDWPIPIDPDDRSQISAKDAAAPLLDDLLGPLREQSE
jgi:dTDP-4-dehydrorhamnose 3,5-epimerase